MEVHLTPEIETKLARLAHQRGVDAQVLARTAIESFVDYDAWFVPEVEKGLAQIDRGETPTHEAVSARIERRISNSVTVLTIRLPTVKRKDLGKLPLSGLPRGRSHKLSGQ